MNLVWLVPCPRPPAVYIGKQFDHPEQSGQIPSERDRRCPGEARDGEAERELGQDPCVGTDARRLQRVSSEVGGKGECCEGGWTGSEGQAKGQRP